MRHPPFSYAPGPERIALPQPARKGHPAPHHFKVPANLIALGAIDFGLIVDAAVNRLAQSEDLHEAVVEGAALRLRPVVMTAM
ncbi:hypothetical protein P3W85_03775, partial [Cupriavidus basilensis]